MNLYEELTKQENTIKSELLNYFKNLRIKRLIKEDFTLDYYQSTNQQNFKFNPSSKLEPAKIRPMGNWYKHYFNELKKNYEYDTVIFAICCNNLRRGLASYHSNEENKEV